MHNITIEIVSMSHIQHTVKVYDGKVNGAGEFTSYRKAQRHILVLAYRYMKQGANVHIINNEGEV